MKLVRMEGYQLKVADELLLLKPFRKLYKADRTKEKQGFMEFLTIIYFVYDPRSDYSYITNEKERMQEVCQTNGIKEPKIGTIEQQCIDLYKKLTTTISQELLQSTKIAISKVREFLETLNLNDKDDKGKPLYTISSVTQAIRQIPQLAKDVMDAEKAVAKELQEQSKVRGGAELHIMENGIDL